MNYEEKIKKDVLNSYRNGIKPKEIYERYGVKKTTLFSWIHKKDIILKKDKRLLNTTKQYKTLEIKYNKLKNEYDILNDAFDALDLDITTKLSISDKLLDKYPLKQIARILHYSGSTLFHHVHDSIKITQIAIEDDFLKEKIKSFFEESGNRLSVSKMTQILKKNGIKCSDRRISRLMNELNLKCLRSKTSIVNDKKRKPTVFPEFNKLKQNFNQEKPNVFWCGDVTMVKINYNKFYIAVVMDLFSRMIIGYAISCRNDNKITISALKMAYQNRCCPLGVTFHSDQGSNYTSNEYKDLLKILKIDQSFSKKGTPYDNSVIEAFFSNLKQGDLNNREFEYFSDLENSVIDYINYYNTLRPHESLKSYTPKEYENEYYKRQVI